MAADAHGKLTGRPGICFVTRGPGATNASAGVHDVFQDSTPMILFIGQVARDMVEREAFQEIDYRRMFGQMAKWVAQIDDATPSGIHHPRLPRRHVGPPRPRGARPARGQALRHAHAAACPGPDRPPPRYLPAPDQMAALRERIARAERPLIMAGGGGWTPQAIAALDKFARAQALPVAVSFRSQGLIDNDHPCYMGHFSTGQPPYLATALAETDLLIALGPRLGEITTAGYTALTPPVPGPDLIHTILNPKSRDASMHPNWRWWRICTVSAPP